jgi:cobalt/nickel transport system permease protein
MHHAYIDKFAYQDSPVHRLDSRVKLVVLVIFTALVISVPRHSLSILACYAVGPFAMLVVGGIPIKFALKHVVIVSPFVLVLAASCILYGRVPAVVEFGPFTVHTTAGWLQFFNILAKFIITMLALIALVSTTRFAELLRGLEKLYVPKLLVIQLGFLYRYIFVLIDSVHHVLRARAGRKLRYLGAKAELKTAGAMVGSLLIRSINTAERVSMAMQARGFDGTFRTYSRMQITAGDYLFCAAAGCFLLLIHIIIRPALI